jgi:hypothetical protein
MPHDSPKARDPRFAHPACTVLSAAVLISAHLARPSFGQLVHRSGFEAPVAVDPPLVSGNQWWQVLRGSDNGYPWENFPAAFQYLVPGSEPLGPYIDTRIETVSGPLGASTRALYMAVKDYDLSFPFGGITRNQYSAYWDPAIGQGYVRYWVKLQPDLDVLMPPGQWTWRSLMSWVENGLDYRWEVHVRRAATYGPYYWAVQADLATYGGAPMDWVEFNTTVPVPVGQWFLLEVYWRQHFTKGRLWIAANGATIVDHLGRTHTNDGVSHWEIFKAYTGPTMLDRGDAYQWIDDVELHETVPCAPCDVNRDSIVDAADIPAFIRAFQTGGTPPEACAGDLETPPDGLVDAGDIPGFVDCLLGR